MSDNWYLAMVYVGFIGLTGYNVWAILTYTFLFGLAGFHIYKHERKLKQWEERQ